MALNTLAIDIGKHSFHLFGIDDDGVIVSRKVSRLKLVATVDRLDPKIIAMEACGSAHHWGRMFTRPGGWCAGSTPTSSDLSCADPRTTRRTRKRSSRRPVGRRCTSCR